jgi:amino acid adenylation domain-containing protein
MASQISEEVRKDIANRCGVHLNDIEDVYPCTPVQVGIMAQPIERIYINCIFATLAPSIDTERFCAALCQVVSANPILRSRIVDCEFGLVQVVLNEIPFIARPSQSLKQVLENEKSAPMRLGSRLFRAALVGRSLILTTHHGIADGGTYHRMFDNMSRAYHGQPLPPHAEFKLFVKYCLSIEETMAKSFWASRFNGQPTIFPKVDLEYTPDASQKLKTRIFFGPSGLGVSLGLMSSYIETAWAMTVTSYTKAESVAFGRVLSGRLPALGGLESTWGPTIVTMPVQVNLKSNSTIGGVIKERARERREALKSPALQYGLTRIRSVSEAARIASMFTTLLNFRTPTDDGRDYSNSDMEIHGEYEAHLPYGLGISIVLDDMGFSVETLFDPNVVGERQTRRILRQFEHILHLLLQSPAGTQLDQLQLLNVNDRREILDWNATMPESPQQSLHTLFRARAHAQPTDLAIDGPDGNATYEQLDRMSDSIAGELQRRGIGAEAVIGLLFEKSIWAVVSQLAVLKAGAVCVPIDPDFPFTRKETIVSASKAVMLLTSATHFNSMARLAPSIMVISTQSVSKLPIWMNQPPGTQDTPSQAAFILFTSGSTGTPKGHTLEHGNLIPSLKTIGQHLDWRPGVRMLQFAAYVWDMSIAEIFGTLLFGGCICIPSEEARESNLEGFIESRRVNCAIFTPTMLRMVTPQEAPSLKTLMSIGEPVDLESVKMWSGHARFFNAWGPSETSCVGAMAELTATSPYPETIGRPLASAIWLVDENDANKLMPIGAVGEIVVESLGVARGYLNDPGQTALSFISPPRWAPSRTSTMPRPRMYRTGDLAKYNPDGSLQYIGRRDNQIKISGQRVELGEIEKVLGSCAAVRHAMTAVQASNAENGHKDLVAVLSLEDDRLPRKTVLKELSAEFGPIVEEHLDGIREVMALRLPSYMVPTAWRIVEDFPRTASLKIDRSSIKKWLTQWEPSNSRLLDSDALTPPASAIERVLQATWSKVLSVPGSEIGRESSFIRLGGDSILAISIATKCRKRGVRVSVATLLRSESLANVAAASELLPSHSSPLLDEEALVDGVSPSSVTLSPFQRLLLQNGSENASKTTSFKFRFQNQKSVHVSAKSIEQVLHKLVQHHPMLRARFVQHSDGTWTQKIVSVPEARLRVRMHSVETPDLHDPSITPRLQLLEPAHESMLVADLIFSKEDQTRQPLVLLTSTCLFDRASWRIIGKDLEALLMDPWLVLSSSTSFDHWVQTQIGEVPTTTKGSGLPVADTEFWDLHKHQNHVNILVEQEMIIDAEVTEAILGGSNRPFNTKPIELLLAAVILSFKKTFTDRATPALYNQHDGRETGNNTSLDTSRTVGCFTTLVPVVPDIGREFSIQEAVVKVKDDYRSVLRDGSGAFASHMLGPNPLRQSDVEILFSFENSEEEMMGLDDAKTFPHLGMLKVYAQCRDRQLRFRIGYDKCIAHQERLGLWIIELEATLRAVASELPHCDSRLTMSETPLLHMDDGDLQGIQMHLSSIGVDISNVETLLPCSQLQEGILFAQLKSSDRQYWMRFTMKLTPTSATNEVDGERVRTAWEALCRTQPILRTVIASHGTKTRAFQQVILKKINPSISYATADPEQAQNIESILDGLKAPHFAAAQPPHHLHLTRVSPSAVYATLHISHALCDERSMRLIGEKLGQAYTNAASLRQGLDLAGYLAWAQQHKQAAQDYWIAHLSGVKPCLVQVLDSAESNIVEKGSDVADVPIKNPRRLNSFCRQHGVTVANLLQVSWSFVLRQCTGAQSLSFGYLHSHLGSLEGAESMLGPLLAMAVYKFEAAPSTMLTQLLKEANKDASHTLEHAACSLSEIHEAIGFGQSSLFNTIMTIYRHWPDNLAVAGDIRVEHLPLHGHTEVGSYFLSISLSVYLC